MRKIIEAIEDAKETVIQMLKKSNTTNEASERIIPILNTIENDENIPTNVKNNFYWWVIKESEKYETKDE